ncbi:hypothetical protein KSS87_017493 [Heliosperma pusillum]|nr:hypothetical protein KSS87_017493 [Heliosperma pusillum]
MNVLEKSSLECSRWVQSIPKSHRRVRKCVEHSGIM